MKTQTETAFKPAPGNSMGLQDWMWTSPNYILERKFDGRRFLLHISDEGQPHRLISKGKEHDRGAAMPQLTAVPFPLPSGSVLDGELVSSRSRDTSAEVAIVNATVLSDQTKQAERTQHLVYVVFDILRFGCSPLTSRPFRERREYLARTASRLPACSTLARQYTSTVEDPEAKHKAYLSLVGLGAEGGMMKHLDAEYGAGWAKVKHTPTYDVVITGFTKGSGKYSDTIGAVKYAVMRDGQLVSCGQCSGMDDLTRRTMGASAQSMLGSVIEIRGQRPTKNGQIREPRFIRFRDDKGPEDCLWSEQIEGNI